MARFVVALLLAACASLGSARRHVGPTLDGEWIILGGDPGSWTPQNIQVQIPGSDPSLWSPNTLDLVRPGSDPSSWSPQTLDIVRPGSDRSSWSPQTLELRLPQPVDVNVGLTQTLEHRYPIPQIIQNSRPKPHPIPQIIQNSWPNPRPLPCNCVATREHRPVCATIDGQRRDFSNFMAAHCAASCANTRITAVQDGSCHPAPISPIFD